MGQITAFANVLETFSTHSASVTNIVIYTPPRDGERDWNKITLKVLPWKSDAAAFFCPSVNGADER